MALKKEIRTGSGLVLSYHRVLQLDIETNAGVGVWVASYATQGERELELEGGASVYSEKTYFHEGWDDGPMTVEAAYEWLKGQKCFKNAEDC